MAIGLVPVLIAGGGIAWVATQGDGAAPPVQLPGPQKILAPSSGSTIHQASAQIVSQGANAAPGATIAPSPGGTMRLYTGATSGSAGIAAEQARIAATKVPLTFGAAGSQVLMHPSGWPASSYSGMDPEFKKKADLAEAYLKEQWDNADEVARVAAADAINKQFESEGKPLKPPLTGHETWGDMLAVVSGAAATIACASYPYTAAMAPLCGIVAAWLSKKFGDWLETKWPAIEKWAQARWDSIEGAASDAYDYFADKF